MAILMEKNTEGNKILLAFNKGEFKIGRDSICDVLIKDFSVSRLHAKLIDRDEKHELEDLGSSNGTFVNGKKVKSIMLKNGDRIKIGTNVIVYYTDFMEQTMRAITKAATPEKQVKVLLIDDVKEKWTEAEELFKSLGYACDFAENGPSALEKLHSSTGFDFIFIASRMPFLDGCISNHRIKLSNKCRKIPLVCTSSLKIKKLFGEKHCLGCSVDGFLESPFSREKLKDFMCAVEIKLQL